MGEVGGNLGPITVNEKGEAIFYDMLESSRNTDTPGDEQACEWRCNGSTFILHQWTPTALVATSKGTEEK